MRRSRSRLAAANGLAFDHVSRDRCCRPRPHVAEQHARHRPVVWPVSMRSSSLSGSALRSPSSTAGNERGRFSRTNRQISATCSWRIALWSPRQLRCAQYTWIGPRGPSTSAQHAEPFLAFVVGTPPPAVRGRRRTSDAARAASAKGSRFPTRAVALEVRVPHGLVVARARRRARRPGCARRPPTPLAARRCRRRRGATSRRSRAAAASHGP